MYLYLYLCLYLCMYLCVCVAVCCRLICIFAYYFDFNNDLFIINNSLVVGPRQDRIGFVLA